MKGNRADHTKPAVARHTSKKRSVAFTNTKSRTNDPPKIKSVVQSLLDQCPLPRDALPYTDDIKQLKKSFEKSQKTSISDVEFWRMLSNVGKSGGLGRKGAKKRAPRTPTLSADEQLEILRLFPDGIGNRDHLPYTAKFDEMHRRFARLTGKNLTKHEFWRGLSRVAKLSRKPKPVYESAPLGGLHPELIQYLEQNNPWWRAEPAKTVPPFRRWAFAEVVDRLGTKLAPIVAVRGSRRVGKSVLQDQLIEELLLVGRSDLTGRPVDPRRILRVVFEDAPGLGGLAQPVQTIVRWYEDNILKRNLNAASKSGQPAYLLFDEVQNLPKWSVQLKILADNTDARIFITGSSALRIAKGQDNLAGRMTTIELGPLRLTEVAGIRGLGVLPAYASRAPLEDWKKRDFWLGLIAHGKKHASIRDQAFRFYSALGGYPHCHSTEERDLDKIRQQVIREVITKTIEHDPWHRPHAPALDAAFVREVYRMVCRYAGQAVGPKIFAEEIQALLGTPLPHKKILEAIEFLADSLLLYRIMPLELLGKKQANPAKLCVSDPFVRNGVLQETVPLDVKVLRGCDESVSAQAGHLIESVLGYFLKGIPGVELAWFPTRPMEPEVDLVLTIGTGRIPVEVKYRHDDPIDSDLVGINAFCQKKAYAADFGLVITQSFEGSIGDNAMAIPASTFLLIR
jgi:predicted AAA+ superfamily ATPase